MVIHIPNPFRSVRSAPRAHNTRSSKITGVSDEQWARLFGADADEPDIVTLYKKTPWQYRATNIVAWMTSRVPIVFYDVGGYKKKKLDPHKELPFSIYEKLSWKRLLYLTSGSLSQHSASYTGVLRNSGGAPIGLMWLSAQNTRPEYTEPKKELFGKKEVKFWVRDLGDKQYGYPYEDIVHVWLPSFDAENEPGQSDAGVCQQDSYNMNKAGVYVGNYFGRGTIQPTIITVPDETQPSEIKRLERWWDRLVGGVENAWKTVGLRAGVEVNKLGDKPSDLAIDVMTEGSKSNISAGNGVPDSMISGKDVNYASGQAQRLNLVEHTVMPRCEFIADAWNSRLFSQLDKPIEMEFLFQKLEIYRRLQEKRGLALKPLADAGIISHKEIRVLIDMPPEIPDDMKDPEPVEPKYEESEQEKKRNDQSVLTEIRQYKKKVESKGVGVQFESHHIPREMRHAMDEYMQLHPQNPFGWMGK